MKKSKTIDLLSMSDSEKIKLIREIRRQIEQKVSERELERSLVSENIKMNCPKGISVTFGNSMRKTVEEPKAQRSYSRLII